MLHAIALPSRGGNTEFTSLRLAHDALPADLDAAIRGRRAYHAYQSRRAPRKLSNTSTAVGGRRPAARAREAAPPSICSAAGCGRARRCLCRWEERIGLRRHRHIPRMGTPLLAAVELPITLTLSPVQMANAEVHVA